MKNYDSEQLRAINASGGHYLVLAPPGCGKTDILSERIVRARESGVAFEDMLCLTFTNRASRGMKNRVMEIVGEEACNIFVGNVHRFCSNLLFNNAVIPENTSIMDEDDLADILIDLDSSFFVNRQGYPDKMKVSLIDQIDGYISQRLLDHPDHALYLPKEFEEYYDIAKQAGFDASKVSPLHKSVMYALTYREYKKQRNMISFSDILILAYEALRSKSIEFKKYRWVQVDEVQDLNALQTAIIDEVTDTSGDFTVMYLGDEQQAIFSFLGAKLDQLEILKTRCQGHIFTLGKNYRSPKYLLDIFNTYAKEELGVSEDLLPKPTKNETCDKWDLILTGNESPEDEDNRIFKMITYYLGLGDEERMAVLVPTNAAADRISNKLNAEGISHFKISGTDMFKTKSYKTLSSFFCVNTNEFNNLAWARLLFGIEAIRTGSGARNFTAKLRSLMMTPSDLLNGETYVSRFIKAYNTQEFVFFDTETTGLNVLEDDIVQIAAFKVKCGEIVPNSGFNIFIHTDREIPAMLGDIVNPLVEAYSSSEHYSKEEGLRLFLDYIGDCPVLGHNVKFDYHILQSNAERYLQEQVTLEIFDSLHLIKCVEPNMRMYKLEFLLRELQLEGKNSHLADEDIAATKALVDYCVSKAMPLLSEQESFMNQTKVQNVIQKMQPLYPMIENLQYHIYQPTHSLNRTIADELKTVYDDMLRQGMIKDLGDKFNIFLRFVQSEWVDFEHEETIADQVMKHVNDMTASISEGDLVNSTELVTDRIFIMTVYKGKGLEFENVVILGANDGTYPFYTVNKVLGAPQRYTAKEVAAALQEKKEDARKFYVALSRAKKRICISYTKCNSFGFTTRVTPFVDSIRHYFYTGK